MKAGLLAVFAALGLLSLAARAEAAPKLDPACFKDVAWEVDPASAPIRIFGCRPNAAIAAPDKSGWVTYTRPRAADGTDAGFIMGRLDAVGPDGVWTFEVADNGGGSGVFPYKLTGRPNADGVLDAKTLTILPLPAK